MVTKVVAVKRRVEQVRHGSRYRGYMEIGDSRLDYELIFATPIAQLDSMEPTEDVKEIRRRFQITMKCGSTDIELTNEEYGFFFQMLVTLAVEFYGQQQTSDNNSGYMGQLLNGEGPLSVLASASIGMECGGSYNFPPKLCKILSSQKFGCKFAAT